MTILIGLAGMFLVTIALWASILRSEVVLRGDVQ